MRLRELTPAAATPPHLRRLPGMQLAPGWVVHRASTFRARLRGLLGTRELPTGHALLLTRTKSIHTLGMAFPLDLVWLTASGEVVRVDEAVPPGRSRRCRSASAVLETRVGDGREFAEFAAAGALAMMATH